MTLTPPFTAKGDDACDGPGQRRALGLLVRRQLRPHGVLLPPPQRPPQARRRPLQVGRQRRLLLHDLLHGNFCYVVDLVVLNRLECPHLFIRLLFLFNL